MGSCQRSSIDTALPDIVTAIVERGEQRGRLLGFPTANLYPSDRATFVRGVWAATAMTADGTWWPAAVNVGTRPTFTGDATMVSIEVHLIGFTGDLYDSLLTVAFIERLREEVRFPSIDALVAQLADDVAAAREIVLAGQQADHDEFAREAC